MSLADDLGTLNRDKSILVLDIECSPITAHVWDVWGKVGGPTKIVEPQRVMCWAAKWYGRSQPVMFASEYHHGPETMLRSVWELVNRADIVVTYNGIRYDIPHLRREWELAGLPIPRPHKDVDLYRVVKQAFKWESNSLNYVASRLGLGSKSDSGGLETWRRCMDGDAAAWEQFKRYNVDDVRLSERLYERLLPHISSHPHVRVGDGLSCNRCGGTDLEDSGSYTAVVHAYGMWRCRTCGGYSRAGFLKRVATTRGVR
jgi:DNA polymerase elongation subunit (family B)